MKKNFSLALGVTAALLVVSTAGYSWNFATHAYIATKIARGTLPLKLNQIYGIMAPDLFNLDFSTWGDNTLRGYTHGIPKEDPTAPASQAFMKVWRDAVGPYQKAVSAGYVAHNDAWSADYVAHWRGIPPPPPFPSPYENEHPGYIIALAVQLDQVLDGYGVWAGLESKLADYGVTLSLDERMTFTENIIEYAGDLLIKRADPEIGDKIYLAAEGRTGDFPALLVKAFPKQYGSLLPDAEGLFRQQMMDYGLLFKFYDEASILSTMAQQMAVFTIQYVAFLLQANPDDLMPLLYSDVLYITNLAMELGVGICEGGNYMQEVNITALYVALQLLLHNVSLFSFM